MAKIKYKDRNRQELYQALVESKLKEEFDKDLHDLFILNNHPGITDLQMIYEVLVFLVDDILDHKGVMSEQLALYARQHLLNKISD